MMRLRFLATVLLAIVSVEQQAAATGPIKASKPSASAVRPARRRRGCRPWPRRQRGRCGGRDGVRSRVPRIRRPATSAAAASWSFILRREPSRPRSTSAKVLRSRRHAMVFVNPKDRTHASPSACRGPIAGARPRPQQARQASLEGPRHAGGEAGRGGLRTLTMPKRSRSTRLLRSSPPADFAELHRVFANPADRPWRAGDRLVAARPREDAGSRRREGARRRLRRPRCRSSRRGDAPRVVVSSRKRTSRIIAPSNVDRSTASIAAMTSCCMLPSSSGGTTILLALNMLENFDLKKRWPLDEDGPPDGQASRRAYRARYLGDPVDRLHPDHLS